MKLLIVFLAASLRAQPLPSTQPLTFSGDPVVQMIDGMSAYIRRATSESVKRRAPSRERLRYIIGAVDARVAFESPELVGTLEHPALRQDTAAYRAYAVRWPALEQVTAEGLLYEPKSMPVGRAVVVPDADQLPEEAGAAAQLASRGFQVLVPTLIDRSARWSGNPKFRMTNQPHREFIYRMGFPVGRHIIGYEVQKVLAAVDWFARQPRQVPIEVRGYGEGGLIALHAAALDARIGSAVISGYFQSHQELWREPIYRNVWGLLKDFGDAELAALAAPRKIIVETAPGPLVSGPPAPDSTRRGAAPGVLKAIPPEAARAEADRAKPLGANIEVVAESPNAPAALQPFEPAERQHRQLQELVDYTQKIVRRSEAVRDDYWRGANLSNMEPYRQRLWNDVIGRMPAPSVAANPRTRLTYREARWDGYELMLDIQPGLFAYGVLLVPKDIKPEERRAVVVAQHGLHGHSQSMFGQPENETSDYRYYRNIAAKLADQGYVVYCPQNPYVGEYFREVQRQANAIGLSLFSFILAQNERLLDWLETLPFVDAKRIGFYGLSYGGKTALRIPPLLPRYALSICSGDFNEWIVKLTTTELGLSYMFTPEYEMNEWNLGHVANHAEMAKMMAPRPFMVERGHRDGVGVDEWVAYEHAKVQRFYDEAGIGDRSRIEFFNGPHRINGVGTVEFLRKFLANSDSR